MESPAVVKRAVVAIWAGIAISALGTVAAGRLGYSSKDDVVFALVFYAIYCIIPYKIGVGSNGVRHLFFVLCGLSVLFALTGAVTLPKPEVIATLVQAPLTIYAVYALLRPEANAWFANRLAARSRR